jgi:hypothetical protein
VIEPGGGEPDDPVPDLLSDPQEEEQDEHDQHQPGHYPSCRGGGGDGAGRDGFPVVQHGLFDRGHDGVDLILGDLERPGDQPILHGVQAGGDAGGEVSGPGDELLNNQGDDPGAQEQATDDDHSPGQAGPPSVVDQEPFHRVQQRTGAARSSPAR